MTSHFEQKEEISMSKGLISSKKDDTFRTKGTASLNAENIKRN